MRITYYSHYFTPEIGAPSARLYDLSRDWIAQGHEVQVVTCFPNHPAGVLYPGYKRGLYMHEQMAGIDVHRHWTYITPNKGFVQKTIGHISYLAGAALISRRRIKKPDVVIGTSPTFFVPLAAMRDSRRFQAPFIMEVRDLWPAIFVELGVLKNKTLISLLERWEIAYYRSAARVVTVTEAFRRDILSRGIPADKVVTIPNGADIDFWSPLNRPDGLASELGLADKFIVLYCGAHGISQALSSVLNCAARLKQYDDIRFVFVGDGAEKDMLTAKARKERLENVVFLDPVDKDRLKQFYALADVSLVPLKNIPLFNTFVPSKMFEIMAMERPIIASVRGEAADILNRSQGAIVVAPEDDRALADAVLALHRDRALADGLGAAGRRFVIENYSRSSLARRYADMLKDAVEESGAGS